MGHGELLRVTQGSSVFDALLSQCRDLASAQLDQAMAGMLGKADAALLDLAAKTQDREAKKLYLEAQDVVRKQGADLAKGFRDAFLAEFKQRSTKGKKTGGDFAS